MKSRKQVKLLKLCIAELRSKGRITQRQEEASCRYLDEIARAIACKDPRAIDRAMARFAKEFISIADSEHGTEEA